MKIKDGMEHFLKEMLDFAVAKLIIQQINWVDTGRVFAKYSSIKKSKHFKQN